MLLKSLKKLFVPAPRVTEGARLDAKSVDPNGVVVGYAETGEPVVVPWQEWAAPSLVLGRDGVGKHTFRDAVFFQQIARGGGLLWIGYRRADELERLAETCDRSGRRGDLSVIDLDNLEWDKAYRQVDLSEMVRQNKIVCLALPSMGRIGDVARAGDMLVADFREALVPSQGQSEPRARTPFIFWAEDLSGCLSGEDDFARRMPAAEIGEMLAQARAAGVAVTVEGTTFEGLEAQGLRETVTASAATKIFFPTASIGTMKRIVEMAGERCVSARRGPFNLSARKEPVSLDMLMALGVGEALLLRAAGGDLTVQRIRTARCDVPARARRARPGT